jgi:hypothetical protein
MRTDSLILHPCSFILTLADGTRLALSAGDGDAARVVSFFARAARLAPAPAPLPSGVRRLLAVTDAERNAIPSHTADVICVLASPDAPRRARRPNS